jgi:tRNA pseudouridine38-40 synthase
MIENARGWGHDRVPHGLRLRDVPRYKLTIAYDGTDFCGWQKQEPLAPVAKPDPRPIDQRPATSADPYISPRKIVEHLEGGRVALRTVQHVLDKALAEILNERAITLGASRTDAGVHARGQVVAFTCEPREAGYSYEATQSRSHEGVRAGALSANEPGRGSAAAPSPDSLRSSTSPSGGEAAKECRPTGWPLERGLDRLVHAINGRLPEDVVVLKAEHVPYGWDPIGLCTSKGYSFTFHSSRTRPLFDRHYVYEVWDALDERAMHEAAQVLVGEHDFAAFTAVNHGRQTTVRTIHACTVTRENDQRVRIDVSGSGFLYNMVRIISGTLFEVGRGAWTAARVREALASKQRSQAGPTLPGRGLCLEWVKYEANAAADA